MRDGRALDLRLRDIIDRRLAPALARAGFEAEREGFVAERGDVRWEIEVEQARWSTDTRLCFTLVWGVDVPVVDEVLGDGDVRAPGIESCLIRGHLGQTPSRLEATWLLVNVAVAPLDRVADARTAGTLLRLVDGLLPQITRFRDVADVQAHLVENLIRGRGAAGDDELRRIRAIAGLSVLLGANENAVRWLDYLEARSSVALAPDVVAERLSALRQRCAS